MVGREPVYAPCNRQTNESLETEKYGVYLKEHIANCPLRWRLSNDMGCTSHDCMLDLVTIRGNLTGDQYILEMSSNQLLYPISTTTHQLQDLCLWIKTPGRIAQGRYLQSQAVTSLPWPARSPDFKPIEHAWDMLGRRVQDLRQMEAALHREWRQLSQQHLQRLTGGRIEAVIQARRKD